MYFLRWIAGYPILIILLVTALYALYNKDNLKHWFNKNDAVEVVEQGRLEIVEDSDSHAAEVTPHAEYTGSGQAQGEQVATAGSDEESGLWQRLFKRNKPVAQAEIRTAEPVHVTEPVVEKSAEAASETEQEASRSWLDAFKRDEPLMETPEAVAAETADQTAEQASAETVVAAESGEEKSGSWLGVFKREKSAAEDTVSTESVEAEEPKNVEAEEAVAAAEPAEEKSGSWLDIFKAKDSDSEASTDQAAQAEQAADETVAAAEPEDEKSGSWLDVFKRKSKPVPAPEEAISDYQKQHKESLRLAREAYWNRDYDAAVVIYENMTKAEPENVDLLGEYGNFLLQAGRMPEALDIYEKAADMLISENRMMEVRPLLHFIGNQDPERADKLSQKIHEKQDKK